MSVTSGARRDMWSVKGVRSFAAQVELYEQRVTAHLASNARGKRDQLHHVQMRAGLNGILNEIRRRSGTGERERLEATILHLLDQLDTAKSTTNPEAAVGGNRQTRPNSSSSMPKSQLKRTGRKAKRRAKIADRLDRGWPSTSIRTVGGGLPGLGKRP